VSGEWGGRDETVREVHSTSPVVISLGNWGTVSEGFPPGGAPECRGKVEAAPPFEMGPALPSTGRKKYGPAVIRSLSSSSLQLIIG